MTPQAPADRAKETIPSPTGRKRDPSYHVFFAQKDGAWKPLTEGAPVRASNRDAAIRAVAAKDQEGTFMVVRSRDIPPPRKRSLKQQVIESFE